MSTSTAALSQTWTWIDGKWVDGNPPLLGPRTHAMWLASSVFDGARAFEGTLPDIRAHARRVNDSAVKLGLAAKHDTEEIVDLATEGVKRFGPNPALYVRPMYWAEGDGPLRHRQGAVGHHQPLVKEELDPQPVTDRTGAERRVE